MPPWQRSRPRNVSRWAVETLAVDPADQLLEIGCGSGVAVSLVCAKHWRDALHVLYRSHLKVRSHLGAVLSIVAAARDGRLLAVALIELDDDRYRVVSARWLGDDEQQAVRRMFEGGRP